MRLFRFVSNQLCMAMAIALSSGVSVAQPGVLSLDEAVRIAEERSQQLPAEDAAALAARELAAAAAEAPDPVLMAGFNNVPLKGPDALSLEDDFMTMRSIGVSRKLTRQDKRDARVARFEREAEAADASRTLALAELQRGTALAWLERFYGVRGYEVLTLQRQQAALQVEAADLAYRSGSGPQSDVFAARATIAAIDDRIAEQRRDNEVATTKLARWIGDAAERPLAAPPAMTTVPFTETNVEAQLAHHPEVALLRKQEEIARAEADIARAATRSDWTIEVMYSQRGPGFSDMMSLNVSKPLQWRKNRRQGRELAAHLAAAARARAQREENTRSHIADARALLQAWRANRQRLDRYSATLIPLATERTVAATTAYRSNAGSLGEVLNAYIGEADTRIAELELELETAMLWAELTYLVPANHGAATGQ